MYTVFKMQQVPYNSRTVFSFMLIIYSWPTMWHKWEEVYLWCEKYGFQIRQVSHTLPPTTRHRCNLNVWALAQSCGIRHRSSGAQPCWALGVMICQFCPKMAYF